MLGKMMFFRGGRGEWQDPSVGEDGEDAAADGLSCAMPDGEQIGITLKVRYSRLMTRQKRMTLQLQVENCMYN